MTSAARALLPCVVVLFGTLARADEEIDVTADVVYGHKHGMALTMDVFAPEEPNGAGVLFMVSGGWRSRWSPPEKGLQIFQALLDAGFTVFSVRHGSSPKYVIPEILEDVRRSVRFVRLRAADFGVDPQRLGVFGGSAGGHLSLMLGTTADAGDPESKDEILRQGNRVAAVVAYFPPTDIRPFVDPESPYYEKFPALQFDPRQAPDCSPLLHVTPDDPPVLLIHGDRDELVPLSHSEKIKTQFDQQNVASELLVLKGAAHGFRGEDAARATEAMVAWFEKHLE